MAVTIQLDDDPPESIPHGGDYIARRKAARVWLTSDEDHAFVRHLDLLACGRGVEVHVTPTITIGTLSARQPIRLHGGLVSATPPTISAN